MNLVEAKGSALNLDDNSHSGFRFLTTEQLSYFYEMSEGSVKTNFSRNSSRFKSGVHYFKVSGEDLKSLRVTHSNLQISSKTRSIILWTERGALAHAKISDSDKAWDVFDTLVDCYFWRLKDSKKDQQRVLGINERNFETDAIKSYVEYCVESGMDKRKANNYYSTLTRETYKKLGVIGVSRDDMNNSQLQHLATSERLIGESLESSIINLIPCRECYYIAKGQMEAYLNIALGNPLLSNNKVKGE